MTPRTEAKRNGDTYYSTGKPCTRGHVTYRYTTNGTCVDCSAEDKRVTPAEGTWKSAQLAGNKTYRGKSCAICSSTTKYTSSRICIVCATYVMNVHELKLLIVRFPSRAVNWYARKSKRSVNTVYKALNQLNLPRRGKPQNYKG